jgi:hypothetical protein
VGTGAFSSAAGGGAGGLGWDVMDWGEGGG